MEMEMDASRIDHINRSQWEVAITQGYIATLPNIVSYKHRAVRRGSLRTAPQPHRSHPAAGART
jgi:hypothetical protein